MIAIAISKPGGPDVLQPIEMPTAAAEIARSADPRRRGRGEPARPDAAGRKVPAAAAVPVTSRGSRLRAPSPSAVRRSRAGVREIEVCALVSGGGYAEYCVAPDVQCLPIPAQVDLVSAGGDAGNVPHGVDERVRARPVARGRVVSRARRRERHRHDGDSDGARVWCHCICDRRHRRKMPRVREARGLACDQLQARRILPRC